MSDHEAPQALRTVFARFNETAQALAASYHALHEQVALLEVRATSADGSAQKPADHGERIARQLQALLRALPGGVLLLDADARVVLCNATAAGMLGAVVGRDWNALLRTLPVASAPDEFTLPDGRRISISISRFDDAGAVVLLADVSAARARHDVQARRARLEAVDATGARLAHELRTPLAAALLQASRLAARHDLPADGARLATRVLERLRHLQNLLDATLALVQGEVELDARCRLGEVIADALGMLDGERRARVRLHVQVPALLTDQELRGQRVLLAGALLQLLDNAAQAAHAEVWLDACADGGQLRISVRDDGPGVAVADAARIFEPYFTTRRRGHGLGLAGARAAVRAHGGELALLPGDRRGACRGACFEIALPLPTQAMASGGGSQAA